MRTPLSHSDAEPLLAEASLVPYAKAALADARRLVEQLLAAGVPAALHRPPEECCSGSKCAPSFEVLVREEDVPHIASLQRGRWEQALAREGLLPVGAAAATGPVAAAALADEEGEPPCPACGTAAPLLEGACSDCGLQLE